MFLINIILIVILLFIGALTAASETSIITSSIVKLRRLSSEGSKTAKMVLKILETPERFFGTILVANNVVGALIASLVTALMIYIFGYRGGGVLSATIIASFLIIIFEVVAKTLAANNPVRISLSLARTVKWLIWFLAPIVNILSVITNFIVTLVAGKTKTKPSLVVEEEIKALIKIGEEESFHKEKYKMLSKVFAFSETLVKDVMVLKAQIVSIDMNSTIDDIMDKALESGCSRFPVYRDKPENIIGIINMKDLLNLSINKDLVILDDIIYAPIFTSAAKKVTELLKEFQKGHTHLALVKDEKGNIEGLVTLEDLLEEIVGEISDEFDIRTESQHVK